VRTHQLGNLLFGFLSVLTAGCTLAQSNVMQSDASPSVLSVTLTDPGGATIRGATVEVFDTRSTKDAPAKLDTVGTTDANGVVNIKVRPGKYLLAVKKADIVGDLSTNFTATFYPLLAYVAIDKEKKIALKTVKMTITNARIVPTETYLQYYDSAEKGKRARLDEVPGHTGRVVKMIGAPVAKLEVQFPDSAVGIRGMRTYTPNAVEFLDPKYTLLVRTYMYNGTVKDAHNIMMLGTDLIPDGRNRLLIENMQEKSGVEIPFEPKANILIDGVVTSFVSNITFVSDESAKPAKLVFRYFYLDDKEVPYNLDAIVSPAAIR
jgi:hypothetical protein